MFLIDASFDSCSRDRVLTNFKVISRSIYVRSIVSLGVCLIVCLCIIIIIIIIIFIRTRKVHKYKYTKYAMK